MEAFRRLRKKTKDTVDSSRQESPSNQSTSVHDVSGFICPQCMISMKSAEELETHWQRDHDSTTNQDSTKGFICPQCMTALTSAEDLQSHWEMVHGVVPPATDHARNVAEVCDDLQCSRGM
ncbi:uncharacterized protein [Antedon mediterranea]|uniref:uncharacterized protein isoform X2 n=1 Tax=Antedon mediterranea TaxID=105859 RepID=UPI003AF6E300